MIHKHSSTCYTRKILAIQYNAKAFLAHVKIPLASPKELRRTECNQTERSFALCRLQKTVCRENAKYFFIVLVHTQYACINTQRSVQVHNTNETLLSFRPCYVQREQCVGQALRNVYLDEYFIDLYLSNLLTDIYFIYKGFLGTRIDIKLNHAENADKAVSRDKCTVIPKIIMKSMKSKFW